MLVCFARAIAVQISLAAQCPDLTQGGACLSMVNKQMLLLLSMGVHSGIAAHCADTKYSRGGKITFWFYVQ